MGGRLGTRLRVVPTLDRALVAVAVAAGVVTLLAAFALPFAPVLRSEPQVRWPLDPAAPRPTMLRLTAYEPERLAVRLSCRVVRAAATTPDGLVLASMAPGSRDLAREGLEIRVRDGVLRVVSSGDVLFDDRLPPDDCTVDVTGDRSALTVAVDGRSVSTTRARTPRADPDVLPDAEPVERTHTPMPEVDALVGPAVGVPGATAADLAVVLDLDDRFDTTPAPLKSALLVTVVVGLGIGGAAAGVLAARRPPRGPPRPGRFLRAARRFRPRVVDLLVPATLVAWAFLAPMTDDDGYYSAMAANVPFSGYVPNYFQLYNQGFTPFSFLYYGLAQWQSAFGSAPVVLRIPATVLGLVTWALVRIFVARSRVFTAGAWWGPAALRVVLAAAFLAWWLPYDAGVRPEPAVATLAVATLVAVAEGLERRRVELLGLAVGLASLGVACAPSGFVALAPLLAAVTPTWRLLRAQGRGALGTAGLGVLVLAPGALGLVAGFADGSWGDLTRAQEIFAPIQRAGTWYDEAQRYAQLFDTTSHFGSYARRGAVVLCLLSLVCLLVATVAARLRDLRVPPRLLLAGSTTALAFVLLLPTPSKPTHHFGALAGIGSIALALALVVVPRLLRDLTGDRVRPTAPMVAVAAATVLAVALVWHGRNLWPYAWGLGMPSYGDYPTVGTQDLDDPSPWVALLVVATVTAWLVARRWSPSWRPVALAVATSVLATACLAGTAAWALRTTAGAAARTASTWSPQADAWVDPLGTRCGAAQRVDVLDPATTRPLTAVLPPPPPGAPVPADLPPPAPDAEPDAPFVGDGWLPSDPPPALPPGVGLRGSFLVPRDGTSADSRTGTTTGAWFALPGPDAAVVVGMSGRLGRDTALRAEYARASPNGPVPLGSRPVSGAREDPRWSWLALRGPAGPPPGADLVRLVAADRSTTTGGWIAFTDPVARSWVPLTRALPPGATVAVDWTQAFLFPCLHGPRQQHGITGPTDAVVGDGRDPDAGLDGWTFDPERGGLLGHEVRESDPTALTVRFRGGPGPRDRVRTVQVYELRPPYPEGAYVLERRRRAVPGSS